MGGVGEEEKKKKKVWRVEKNKDGKWDGLCEQVKKKRKKKKGTGEEGG